MDQAPPSSIRSANCTADGPRLLPGRIQEPVLQVASFSLQSAAVRLPFLVVLMSQEQAQQSLERL